MNPLLSPKLIAGFIGLLLVLLTAGSNAGSLNAPAAPSVAASAMFSITDLYNRLNTGAAGAKRVGAFVEPTGAPASTVYTLDQIMGLMPTVDNTGGATAGDVLSGKTFWGLTSGAWGSRTGTMPTQTLSSANTTVSAGYYAATTLNAVDTNLAATNIVSGITIFGITGSAVAATGTATAADVLGPKTFSNSIGANIAGTMPTQTVVNTTTAQNAGYYAAFNLATADADLAATNIVSPATIFGVTGSAVAATGVALPADVRNTITFSNASGGQTGTMPTQTLNAANTTVSAGYYVGTTLNTVDTDLNTANIKSGINIFGVAGNVIQASGTATAGDVRAGVTFSNASGAQTGAAFAKSCTGSLSALGRWCTRTNGTVMDMTTGLIWLKDASCRVTLAGINNGTGKLPWVDTAIWSSAVSNGTCSLTDGSVVGDWRLPTISELKALVTGTEAISSSSPGSFVNIQSGAGIYWSSTTYTAGTNNAWSVNLDTGFDNWYDKTSSYYVWPVRGGL
jgi:hypothetical protein